MSALTYKRLIHALFIIAIVSTASIAYVYVTYEGRIASLTAKVKSLEEQLARYRLLTIVDDTGYVTTLTYHPKRIVSLAPSVTETLFALGSGDKVIGVTKHCDYPPELLKRVKEGRIEVIGTFVNPSAKKIEALWPDLVIGTGHKSHVKIASILRDKGLKVVLFEPESLDEVLQKIVWIGRITGVDKEANELVVKLRNRMDDILKRVAGVKYRPKVYYEARLDPLTSVGPSTWVHHLIWLAGGVNVFRDAKVKYPNVSIEDIVERNPDVIIIPKGHKATIEEIIARPGWKSINAVINRRIHVVNPDIILRPSPRIVEGLEALAKILHPELWS